MRRYRILRIWAVALSVLAAVTLVAATVGIVWWALVGHGFWQTAAVIAIGAWMLCTGDGNEEQKLSRIADVRGLALIALGISISLDELAVGFTIGLVELPITAVVAAIALQALIATQLGLAIGTRISERLRERAEQMAGIALILLGAYLITGQLAH